LVYAGLTGFLRLSDAGCLNIALHFGLSLLKFAFMHDVIFSSFGISDAQKRMASPLQAAVCSSRVAAKTALPESRVKMEIARLCRQGRHLEP